MQTNMKSLSLLASCGLVVLSASCQAGTDDTASGGFGGGTSASTSVASTSEQSSGQGGGFNVGGMGQGGGLNCTPGGPNDDVDQDGFTPAEGDCEDCDPNRNPNAIEVATEPGKTAYDENCDGQVDEPESDPCDDAIAIDDGDPMLAGPAIELCRISGGPNDWGLVSAEWVMADGQPPPAGAAQLQNFHLGHGFLSAFGPNVDTRRGSRMLAVSSGSARAPNDPGYQNVQGFGKGYSSGHPQGFPKESPACPGTMTGQPNDSTGVELVVRTPSNATGFSFDFNFYTYEWPDYVCSTFNDFFVALLEPFPMGQTDGNISFDSQGNPVSVNNALLEVCGCPGNPPNACMAGGKLFNCSLGNIELIGTGFGFDTGFSDHAATSWLRTTAPVDPASEIRIRFATYDSGDGALDSTTLVDNFKWIAKPGVMVGTNPVPE